MPVEVAWQAEVAVRHLLHAGQDAIILEAAKILAITPDAVATTAGATVSSEGTPYRCLIFTTEHH